MDSDIKDNSIEWHKNGTRFTIYQKNYKIRPMRKEKLVIDRIDVTNKYRADIDINTYNFELVCDNSNFKHRIRLTLSFENGFTGQYLIGPKRQNSFRFVHIKPYFGWRENNWIMLTVGVEVELISKDKNPNDPINAYVQQITDSSQSNIVECLSCYEMIEINLHNNKSTPTYDFKEFVADPIKLFNSFVVKLRFSKD